MNISIIYFLLCVVLLGRGDDYWKNRKREKIEHDNGIFKKRVALERDEKALEHYFNSVPQIYHHNYVHPKLMKFTKDNREVLRNTKSEPYESSLTINDNIHFSSSKNMSHKPNSLGFLKFQYKHSSKYKKVTDTTLKWPSFEDLLLSVGVEYDWKSDRWIKMKQKLTKSPDKTIKTSNFNQDVGQKHEFKYRTVRINGSKSRKNIIIAVTAVR
ncbi:unnamed protein product [Parnassius apollo]|uniref:(apollo) hypothetical protein n=1 Tax=Parnassius apollo TaxID=110799 RepID=A0A8S3Y1Y6_PARAO|nr:unnamed protein product [Parnassius apollo]